MWPHHGVEPADQSEHGVVQISVCGRRQYASTNFVRLYDGGVVALLAKKRTKPVLLRLTCNIHYMTCGRLSSMFNFVEKE